MKNAIINLWKNHRPMHVFTPDEYSRPMTRERIRDTRRMAIPLFLFFFCYMIIFYILEHKERIHYTVIHTRIDDIIPFCEYFIIPYLLWFVFVAGCFLFFLLKHDKDDYYKCLAFMFTGMYVFLLVSALFPNILHLRPETFPRENFCTDLVRGLYATDTSTNVFPSIHVYNSIGVWLAVKNSRRFEKRPFERGVTLVTMILIILSTMFLKQHSAMDVVAGIGMAAVIDFVVYHTDFVVNRLGLSPRAIKQSGS